MNRTELVAALEQIAVGAVGLTTRALAEAAPGVELTLSQWRALFIVGESADGARVGQVAVRVGVTVPATGRLLRRLERRGLVALATDERDHRATRVRLTPRGAEVRASIIEFRWTALEAVASTIDGADGADGVDGVEFGPGMETVATELGQYV
jgi:DNA-binding MarR family transcriptional regulator